jgi:hypothetical protein
MKSLNLLALWRKFTHKPAHLIQPFKFLLRRDPHQT